MWRWDQQEPFGNNVPDENPSGLGVFDLPLRLPGQYFDKETNLHYNHNRDYNPSLGIYVESDPLGLVAGLNTYAYVVSNPLTYIDPEGLMLVDPDSFSPPSGTGPSYNQPFTPLPGANMPFYAPFVMVGQIGGAIIGPPLLVGTVIYGGAAAACTAGTALVSAAVSQAGRTAFASLLQLTATNSALVSRVAPGLAGTVPASMAQQIARQAALQAAAQRAASNPRITPSRIPRPGVGAGAVAGAAACAATAPAACPQQ